MKATLQFDTSDPDQARELKLAMASGDMAGFIFELLNNAHREYKDREDEAGWEEVFGDIQDLAIDHGIDWVAEN
jgi:hypothetical protein